jgi:hypothetical protein
VRVGLVKVSCGPANGVAPTEPGTPAHALPQTSIIVVVFIGIFWCRLFSALHRRLLCHGFYAHARD